MVKTVTIGDDVYEALDRLVRPGESVSDVIRRLTDEHRPRRSIEDSAGKWPMAEREAKRLISEVRAERDRSAKGRPFS